MLKKPMEPIHFESLYPDNARFFEIDQILKFIKEGHSCQLVGMPGVGRGTTLGLLAHNKQIREKHLKEKEPKYHFVLVNFAEVKNRPLLDVTKFIFLELVESLHERKREEEFALTDHIFKDSLSYNDELVLFQGLKKAIDFLSNEKQLSLVFLFERFEVYLPMLTDDFFTNLRSIYGKAKYKFSVVFSLERPLEDIVEPQLIADFYEFFAGHTIYSALFDEASFQFRKNYLEKLTKTTLPAKKTNEILTFTGGHAKLTKLCLEYAFAHLDDPGDMGVLLKQKTVKGALIEIWQFFTPLEQKQIKEALQTQQIPQNLFLFAIHLFSENICTIPLFVHFIQDHTKEISSPIVYDNHTNTIIKGDAVLSDDLTASEFKLLYCLLLHQNQVVEKEEIIHSVWKEAASTAGVTDQALDQLVFRLRKKIEDDPNRPSYIQTVKGRGFKLVQ